MISMQAFSLNISLVQSRGKGIFQALLRALSAFRKSAPLWIPTSATALFPRAAGPFLQTATELVSPKRRARIFRTWAGAFGKTRLFLKMLKYGIRKFRGAIIVCHAENREIHNNVDSRRFLKSSSFFIAILRLILYLKIHHLRRKHAILNLIPYLKIQHSRRNTRFWVFFLIDHFRRRTTEKLENTSDQIW